MMPFLPLVSFAAVAMGMLNAEERFGDPGAVARRSSTWSRSRGPRVLLGAGLQPATGRHRLGARHAARAGSRSSWSRCPSLRRLGWRFRAGVGARATRGLRQVGRLMAPATVGPRRRAGQHLRQQHLRLAASRGRCPGSTTPSACSTCRSASSASPSARSPPPGLARRAAEGDMEGLRDDAAPVALDARVPDDPGDGRADGARRADRAAALRARPVHAPPTRGSTATRALALLLRPRRLHGREGAGARLLRARHAARAARWPAPSPSPTNLAVIFARPRQPRLPRDRARHGARLAAERRPACVASSSGASGGLLGHGLFRRDPADGARGRR